VKWKTAIAGRGHSSPIVWGKEMFLTTALDGENIPGRKPGVTHKLSDGSEFVQLVSNSRRQVAGNKLETRSV
jgi:hypothetical protein